MGLARPCLRCGALITSTRHHRCQRSSGRNNYRWQKLRALRRAIDGHRCVYCGATEDLTVDLDPHLQGNHHIATLDDCVTACRSCNSSGEISR